MSKSVALPVSLSVTVRPATVADLAAVQAIYAHHVRHGTATFEIDPPDLAEIIRRHADVCGRQLPYLVAEGHAPDSARASAQKNARENGRILGYGYAAPYRLRPAYRYTVENSIYVDEEMRGLGVGRAILSALISECTARSLRRMVAIIGDGSNAASIGLHAALGFEMVGMLPGVGYKFGRWIDSVIMQRALGDGSVSPPLDRAPW